MTLSAAYRTGVLCASLSRLWSRPSRSPCTALSFTASTRKINCANLWLSATALVQICTLLNCARNLHQTHQVWQALSAHAMAATSRPFMHTSTDHLPKRATFNTSTQATSLHRKLSSSKHHQYVCRLRLQRWHKLASHQWKPPAEKDRARLHLPCHNKTSAAHSWPRCHGNSSKSTSLPLPASKSTTPFPFPAPISQ